MQGLLTLLTFLSPFITTQKYFFTKCSKNSTLAVFLIQQNNCKKINFSYINMYFAPYIFGHVDKNV